MDMLSTVAPESTSLGLEWSNATDGSTASQAWGRRGGSVLLHVIKAVYVVGIVGNALAIVVIRRGERRVRNRKYLLLLTALAANDLVALIGQLSLMLVSESFTGSRWYCAARVLLRVFGIGSVCIAVVMALERYLALTRPFLYQKQVTYYVIRTALLVSWLWAAALTCAPMLGLGLYYDQSTGACLRYRNAETALDFGYAVFYVMFGTLLCVMLVYCNVCVIRALYAITSPGCPAALRRLSRSSTRQQPAAAHSVSPQQNFATAEEVFFSRLMATLSVLFMICWLPQMVMSSLFLALGKHWWARLSLWARIADLLMLLNYVLDPVLYVLLRRTRVAVLTAAITHCCRNHKSSTESMKTSCCPQETLLVTDSSLGAEMKSLQNKPSAQ